MRANVLAGVEKRDNNPCGVFLALSYSVVLGAALWVGVIWVVVTIV